MPNHSLPTSVVTDCTSPEDFVRKYHTHAHIPFDLEAMTKPGNSYVTDFEKWGLTYMDPYGSRLGRWTVWCPEGKEKAEQAIRAHMDEIGFLLPLSA